MQASQPAEGVQATLQTQPPKVCLAIEVSDNIWGRKIPTRRQDRSLLHCCLSEAKSCPSLEEGRAPHRKK